MVANFVKENLDVKFNTFLLVSFCFNNCENGRNRYPRLSGLEGVDGISLVAT